jgi:predicted Zn-dependent protease with MMP-like domain
MKSSISRSASVTDTVHHEIAHEFGISDELLHELRRGEP